MKNKPRGLIIQGDFEKAVALKNALDEEYDTRDMPWTGVRNYEEFSSKDRKFAVIDISLLNGESKQNGIDAAREAEKAGLEVIVVGSADDFSREMHKNGQIPFPFICKDSPSYVELVRSALDERFEAYFEVPKEKQITVGITGLGNAGMATFREIEDLPFIKKLGFYSEHLKGNYKSLLRADGCVEEGNKREGFSTMEKLVNSDPEVVILTTGDHEMKYTADLKREDEFEGNANASLGRYIALIKSGYPGLIKNEVGPQDMQNELLVELYRMCLIRKAGGKDALDYLLKSYELLAKLVGKDVELGKANNTSEIDTFKGIIDSFSGSIGDTEQKVSDFRAQITGVSPDTRRSKHFLRNDSELGVYSLGQIDHKVVGGRRWPIPVLSSTTVDGKPLFSIPGGAKYEKPQVAGSIRGRIICEGDLVPKDSEKTNVYYKDIARVTRGMLRDISLRTEYPAEPGYGYSRDDRIFTQLPLKIAHQKEGIRVSAVEGWKDKFLTEGEKEKYAEGIKYQKKINTLVYRYICRELGRIKKLIE